MSNANIAAFNRRATAEHWLSYKAITEAVYVPLTRQDAS
jgi:hypothetical protein